MGLDSHLEHLVGGSLDYLMVKSILSAFLMLTPGRRGVIEALEPKEKGQRCLLNSMGYVSEH